MKKPLLIFSALFFSISSFAQTKISGKITDGKKPMVGVSIAVKDSYDGTSSNADGSFSFETSEKGDQILVATFIGFNSVEQKINCNGTPIVLNISMKEKFNELKAVTISAGSFDASDKKRATVFTPLDIVTTAGSGGDITGALKTLPGTQQIGNQEGLFVRGGEGRETQTFIDGMLVRNPYNTSVPDISQRGKFNPFLFKGTSFSSGGYSALYGQGLSSALVLETKDLPEKTETNLSLSSVGLGIGHNHLFEKENMSIGANAGYFNLSPYYGLIKQNIEFTKMPENKTFELNFRKKFKKHGILKFYGYANENSLGIKRPDINDAAHLKSLFELKSTYYYSNLTYSGSLNANWGINAGASFSGSYDKINFGEFYNNNPIDSANKNINSSNSLSQGRIVFTRYTGALSALRFGAEYQYAWEYAQIQLPNINTNFTNQYFDNYAAAFVEDEIYLNNKFVLKPGVRAEYSSIINKTNAAPRLSLAYRLGRNSQLGFAYGDFYEKPDRKYLLYQHNLDFERATHFVLNYQRIFNDKTFRIEAFYKKYESLILTPLDLNLVQNPSNVYATNFDPKNISNLGSGYAQGLEFFLRDKKTIKNCDYWIDYSYIDTKRQFSYSPISVQPDFAATHTANLVFKQFFPKLMLGYGVTYSWASGRPYYNPTLPSSKFMSDRTMDYNALGMNANYLTHVGKAFTVLVLGVSNVLGNQQIFGYHYSNDGTNREPIGLTATRFLFVGCFMSWGVDRRQQQVDDNLK